LPLRLDSTEKPLDEVTLPPQSTVERELSLFGADFPQPDDEPLIKRPSAPRAPLAVRRSTPEVPRLRTEQPRAQSLDLVPDDAASARRHPQHSQPAPAAARVQVHLLREDVPVGEHLERQRRLGERAALGGGEERLDRDARAGHEPAPPAGEAGGFAQGADRVVEPRDLLDPPHRDP